MLGKQLTANVRKGSSALIILHMAKPTTVTRICEPVMILGQTIGRYITHELCLILLFHSSFHSTRCPMELYSCHPKVPTHDS